MPHVAQLGSNGFMPEIAISHGGSYSESVELESTDNGFFIIDWTAGVFFYQVPAGITSEYEVTFYAHGFTTPTFVSPSGHYTANASGTGQLSIFRSTDPNVEMTSAAGCPTFLAWTKGTERMACAYGADIDSRVNIFDLVDTTTPTLTPSVVAGTYAYSQADYPRRRAFSRTGTWFAFEAAQYFYVAALSGGSPRLLPAAPLPDVQTGNVELAFSDDEKWLLHQRGPDLLLHSLVEPEIRPVLTNNEPLQSPPICEQVFRVAPKAWCGNARNSTKFVWSRDSQFVAFLAASGTLYVLSVPNPMPTFVRNVVNTPCGPTCVSQFEFQP
jgi:hypothetical protein